ncbi:MAG: zf-TFIIB domain-containing protein [Actinomycetota bacterium]|nr:zf-TFIIB domain-containing protein [Actinomycetota bacterium]
MDATTAPLVCPKCGAAMRTYERSGMNIDQCTGCRGVFLDRGELDRLIDAESTYYADRGYTDPGYSRERYDDDDEGYGFRRRGRRGFLGGLFEGDD